MNIVEKILNAITKQYVFKRNAYDGAFRAHRNNEPIKPNEVVEFAVEETDGIKYVVEEILASDQKVRIRRIAPDGTRYEAYTVAIGQVRHPVQNLPIRK